MARSLALLAFIAMVGFYAVFVIRVPRIDLTVFVLLGVGLAGYDLWDQLLRRRR